MNGNYILGSPSRSANGISVGKKQDSLSRKDFEFGKKLLKEFVSREPPKSFDRGVFLEKWSKADRKRVFVGKKKTKRKKDH